MNEINKHTYKIEDNGDDYKKAVKLANEWEYNKQKGKIPVGVLYQRERESLEEEWPQLKKLLDEGVGWKGLKKNA